MGIGAFLASIARGGDLPVTPPKVADQVTLCWLNGAPILNAFRPEDKALASYRPENSALVIRGAHYGMVVDRSQPGLITRFNAKPDADFATSSVSSQTIEKNWAESSLHLAVTWKGKEFVGVPGPVEIEGSDWTDLPVRMIETGSWFQHIQLTGIAMVAADGESLPAEATLDVRAWGDRAVVEWTITPKSPLEGAEASLVFQSGGELSDASVLTGSLEPARLRVAFHCTDRGVEPGLPESKGISIAATAAGKTQPQASFSELSGGWEVVLPSSPWPNPDRTDYPEALLDRVNDFGLTIENSSSEEVVVPLRMIHPDKPFTGVVPMLVDAEGRQTGLPVQVSKNWHLLPDKRLQYDGTWVHGSAFFRVPARSTTRLGYKVVYARWQGAPAASVAQLCLVGWGGHGNWNQFALGSWGETFCVQPERMMRRALIADVRPFLVEGSNGKKWSWPSNVGGGDVMDVLTADGKYLPWRTTLTESRMIGPNLAHLRVEDVARDGRLAMKTDVYLPRSDDFVRTYLRVRLDVIEDVDIDRVAFFQLGADYYNENTSNTVAFGAGSELVAEHQPELEPWKIVVPPVEMTGKDPWITLYGKLPAADSRLGYGTRGLIVREYAARLGGEASNTPYFAAYTPAAHGKPSLGAEIVSPPALKTLRKGDWVEFNVEFVVFPPNRESFYGQDPALIQNLEQNADTWRMTAWEAAANQPRLVQADGTKTVTVPLETTLTDLKTGEFHVEGGSGLVPVRVTGLPNYDRWAIEEEDSGKWQKLGERFPEEAKPQITYQPDTKDWEVVLSLRTTDSEGIKLVRKLRLVGGE